MNDRNGFNDHTRLDDFPHDEGPCGKFLPVPSPPRPSLYGGRLTSFYVLGPPDGQTPMPVDDSHRWAEEWEQMVRDHRNVVCKTDLWTLLGKVRVSTVFLGIDHGFLGEGSRPVLWETMVFGRGWLREYQERYDSHDEAANRHERIVQAVRIVYNSPSRLIAWAWDRLLARLGWRKSKDLQS